jgi:hypothetical protein
MSRPRLRRLPVLRLTPQERRSLALVAGLFLLGAAVRWLRLRGCF